ncbi:MAG: protein phosphatase 2C domain-containing protein [Candidatus Promineifilaceae bacterium]|nr:protein phosphatase 2C domain-containing protein [Candidatus Promineifilaceae bacterium]
MERVQSSSSKYKIAYATHEGMSGKANEDSLGVFAWQFEDGAKVVLGVVADGVGGQIAGEVASRLAVDSVKSYFDKLTRAEHMPKHIEQAILSANRNVHEASRENPEYRGMSTTMVVAAVVDGQLYTGTVGDSRIYLLRDGKLRQISVDHTWAQEAIEAGLLTRQQAKQHPNRNVIRRHLGGSLDVEVDHRLMLKSGQSLEEAEANQGATVRPGDTLLLCSDGLTDMITDQSVADSLAAHYDNLERCANELVDKANEAGGKDNITIVLIQVPGGQAPGAVVPVGEPEQQAAPAAAAAPAAEVSAPAPAQPAAAAPTTTAAAVPSARASNSFPLLAVGGLLVLFVIVGAAVVFLLFGGLGDDEASTATAEPTAEVTLASTSSPAEAATVAPLSPTDQATATVETEATDGATAPALQPTLRPTNTATPTPTPRPTNTPTPTPTPTPQPPPPGGGGGDEEPTPVPPTPTQEA